MSYYIYSKPETIQVERKTNWYRAIMWLIWTLIWIVSSINNIMAICLWWLNVTEIPLWLCVAVLINFAVSLTAWELIGGDWNAEK